MSVVFIHEARWLQTVVLPINKKHLLAIWASWVGELQLEKSDHAFVGHRLGTNQKPRLLRRRLTRSKKLSGDRLGRKACQQPQHKEILAEIFQQMADRCPTDALSSSLDKSIFSCQIRLSHETNTMKLSHQAVLIRRVGSPALMCLI